MRSFASFLAAIRIAGLCACLTAAHGAHAQPLADYRLSALDISARDAAIDWYPPDEVDLVQQRRFIEEIFRGGVDPALAAALTGERAAVFRISVAKFDILSNIEQLFCCAVNEVDATFELVDAETGETLIAPEMIGFDHIGRGGFLGLIAAAQGEGQLDRLQQVIRENTEDWLREKLD